MILKRVVNLVILQLIPGGCGPRSSAVGRTMTRGVAVCSGLKGDSDSDTDKSDRVSPPSPQWSTTDSSRMSGQEEARHRQTNHYRVGKVENLKEEFGAPVELWYNGKITNLSRNSPKTVNTLSLS